MLALVMLAGSNAWAATDDGLAPGTAKAQVVGSTTTFSFGQTSGSSIVWFVLQAEDTYVQGETTAEATAGTHFNWVTDNTGWEVTKTSPTVETAYVKWLSVPSDPNDIYIVRMEETTGSCSTIREVFISIFDFTFDVYLSDATGVNIEETSATTICNDWDGTVVANLTTSPAVDPLDGTSISTPHANYVNNETDNNDKLTQTWYTVEVSVQGAATKTMAEIALRMQYSLPTTAGLSLYKITAPTGVTFSTTTGNENIVAADATGTLAVTTLTANDYASNNTFYVPSSAGTLSNSDKTKKFTFLVETHNNLGAAAMTYAIQIDKTDLDFHPDATTQQGSTFGNGSKVNNAVIATYANDAHLADGEALTETATINQSPATPVITITD